MVNTDGRYTEIPSSMSVKQLKSFLKGKYFTPKKVIKPSIIAIEFLYWTISFADSSGKTGRKTRLKYKNYM